MGALPVVFAGPSLPPSQRPRGGFDFRPPACCGDVVRAVRDGARAIGLIDGVFESARPTWHKELLFALSEGVAVLGGGSMGALRAAEMAAFGMRGVGIVFRLYRRGVLVADDEVAMVHLPEELDFRASSEPLVNIRVNLRRARRSGVIGRRVEDAVVAAGQALFYQDRQLETVLAGAAARGCAPAEMGRLRAWLDAHWRDVKREDAGRLLAALPTAGPPSRLPEFQGTVLWSRLLAELDRPPRDVRARR